MIHSELMIPCNDIIQGSSLTTMSSLGCRLYLNKPIQKILKSQTCQYPSSSLLSCTVHWKLAQPSPLFLSTDCDYSDSALPQDLTSAGGGGRGPGTSGGGGRGTGRRNGSNGGGGGGRRSGGGSGGGRQ